jgi:hypothetical protein
VADEQALDPPRWTRRIISEAQISIAVNPAWPILSQPYVVYQTFGSDNGALSVHWGEAATMEWFLAHTGVGSAGHTRVINEDQWVQIGALAARRVRLLVISKAHGTAMDANGNIRSAQDEGQTIFVTVAFEVRGEPVRVGYRLPLTERAEFEAVLERVLGGVRPT